MKQLIIYVHGMGGSADEAEHYKQLFPNGDVIGFDYKVQTPWQAKEEFAKYYDNIRKGYDEIILIANSLGAYFSLCSLGGKAISKTFLISPIVDMERLIMDMMSADSISESELEDKKEITTKTSAVLSWEYLCYVRQHPIKWDKPTYILYGGNDMMTSLETIKRFADKASAKLAIMENGEHWFHTDEQMEYLDKWIRDNT